MSATRTVPVRIAPAPQPPNDPTSLLLDARAGWRAQVVAGLDISPLTGALALAPSPRTERRLSEPSGSFGGLRLPYNVACGPAGLYLLDRTGRRLKRFDPCCCEFVTVPCFGGAETTASDAGAPRARPRISTRVLADPNGMAICGGSLYVCDTGHARVLRIMLAGYATRAVIAPPRVYFAKHNLTQPWQPFALAFDGAGTLHVSDPTNGCVHRLRAGGDWLDPIVGLGRATFLSVDCCDRLYVVIDAPTPIVQRFDAKGGTTIGAGADAVAPCFPPPPVAVDARGQLHLEGLCGEVRNCNGSAIFDLDGNPVQPADAALLPQYAVLGSYRSEALDSQLYRCQWHRIVVSGAIPKGTRIELATTSAEIELGADEVDNLPEQAWQTRAVLGGAGDDERDALVRSGPGRYLWLRLTMVGGGAATPRIDHIVVEFPRVSLRRFLPAVYGQDAVSADFTDRFLALYDTTLRSIERKLDNQGQLFDPLSAPSERPRGASIDFLTWLATWLGITLDRQWPEAKRRAFLKRVGSLYSVRGTRYGLWRVLLAFLDMDDEHCCCPDWTPKTRCIPRPTNCAPVATGCAWTPPPLILEHFTLRRWLFVGAGKLGDDAVLWGKRIVARSQLGENARVGETALDTVPDPVRDPFRAFAHKFTVFVPACVRGDERLRRSLAALLSQEAPAHAAHEVAYVEPRFRVGVQAMIGYDSVIARTPHGVAPGQAQLRQGTVLDGARRMRPGTIVGDARVGTTTRIN
jgi:phage tail-like protein